ncbi:hypothetical protein TYRP_010273 [Tyrophagus putrescentiae]|nr:hypothetical protein TYRP_010273 [Tyrophagus putrescentiae]
MATTEDAHKPLFYNTINYVYADTYAANKEARKQAEAQQKFRTKFRVEKNRDPMAVLEPKDYTYFATTFIIWAFLCTVFAFKMALREHLFWVQGIWCLSVGVLSCFYVHFLYQLK